MSRRTLCRATNVNTLIVLHIAHIESVNESSREDIQGLAVSARNVASTGAGDFCQGIAILFGSNSNPAAVAGVAEESNSILLDSEEVGVGVDWLRYAGELCWSQRMGL
jgi:hypothetical protein